MQMDCVNIYFKITIVWNIRVLNAGLFCRDIKTTCHVTAGQTSVIGG